jgi:hypothetical protein
MQRTMRVFLLGCSLAIAACAQAVKQEPVSALQPAEQAKQFRVVEGLDVRLSTGFTTHIKPQTSWSLVGSLPQGEVYKSRDQVLTVEGADVAEAYLVVAGDELVGFYLPVEHALARISPARRLSIER